MKEQRLVEIFRSLDEGPEYGELFFSGRIHAVIVQAAFSYGDNAGVGGYDFPYAEYVGRCGVLSYMGMDTCSTVYIVGADKGIHFFIIVRLSTGEYAAYIGRFGIGFTASPRHADGVVVSGPVTVNMAEALEICYDAVAEPKILVACGSEACSGGLFADSRAVDRTFFDTHTPDLWLPGAHPMTYIDGMMNLLGRKTRQ